MTSNKTVNSNLAAFFSEFNVQAGNPIQLGDSVSKQDLSQATSDKVANYLEFVESCNQHSIPLRQDLIELDCQTFDIL